MSFLDGHLNSPLTHKAGKFLLNHKQLCGVHYHFLKNVANLLRISIPDLIKDSHVDFSLLDCWEFFGPCIEQNFEPFTDDYFVNFNHILGQLLELIPNSIIHHWVPDRSPDFKLKQLKSKIRKNGELIQNINRYHQAGELKTRLRTLIFERQSSVHRLSSQIILGEKFSFISIDHKRYIVETILIIGYLDKIQEKAISHLTNFIEDIVDPLPEFNRELDFLNLCTDLEDIRSKVNNDFFKIMKDWEPLTIGCVVRDDPKYPSAELHTTVTNSMEEIYPKICQTYFYKRVQNILSLPTPVQQFLISTASYNKLYGHPHLDIDESVDQTRQRCVGFKLDTIPHTVEVAGMIKKLVCKGYFNKHNKWLGGEQNLEHPILQDPIQQKRWLNKKEDKLMTPTLWFNVKLAQVFELDLNMPLYDLISDTALSPQVSAWPQAFDECCFKQSGLNYPEYERSQTRVVNEYIHLDENYIGRVLNDFDTKGELPPNERLCVISPKELELSEGRFFCKQTMYVRTIQTVVEKNIKDKILSYIDYQSLTMSGTKLTKKKAQIAGLVDYPRKGCHTAYANLDYRKWNTQFRYENTAIPFSVLDEMFGTKFLFQNTHKLFSSCHVLYQNRNNAYLILNSNGLPDFGYGGYSNHRGGFEGLRQKCWTLLTTAALKLHNEKFNFVTTIIGQGDNQVVCIEVPSERALPNYINTFLTTLTLTFEELKLPLKPEETYVSSILFSYGKEHYLHGAEVQNGHKKIRRGFPDGNESLISFAEDMSSSMTAVESCARASTIPTTALIMSCFFQYELLKRNQIISVLTPTEDIIPIMVYNHHLGGLSHINGIGIFMRGFEDNVSYHLSYLRHIIHCKKCKLQKNHWEKYLKLDLHSETNLDSLYESPYSLNIKQLQPPRKWLTNEVSDYLIANVTNPELVKWFDYAIQDMRDDLNEKLWSAEPQYPAVSSEIKRCSVVGITDSLTSRLTNVKTILRTVTTSTESGAQRILQTFITELKHLREFVSSGSGGTINLYKLLNKHPCSYRLAYKLRKYWGKELEGVTVAPPCEQVRLQLDHVSSDLGYFTQINDIFSCENRLQTLTRTRGTFTPYLGSTTKERQIRNVNLDQKIIAMRGEVKRAQTIYAWTKLIQLSALRPIVREQLDLLVEFVQVEDNVIQDVDDFDSMLIESGTVDHRFNCAMGSRSYQLNQLINLSTHCSNTSNTLNDNLKSRNLNIVYQSIFLYMNSSLVYLLNDNLPSLLKYYFSCCLEEVCEENIHIDDDIIVRVVEPPEKSTVILSSKLLTWSPRQVLGAICGARLGSFELQTKYLFDTHNSIDLAVLDKKSDIIVNLNDLRKCDLSTFCSSLLVHSKILLEIDSLLNLERLYTTHIFLTTANKIIEAGMMSPIIRFFNRCSNKHSELLDPSQFANFFTHQLVNFISDSRFKFVITELTPVELTMIMIKKIIKGEPLYPVRLFIKNMDYEICSTNQNIYNPDIFEEGDLFHLFDEDYLAKSVIPFRLLHHIDSLRKDIIQFRETTQRLSIDVDLILEVCTIRAHVSQIIKSNEDQYQFILSTKECPYCERQNVGLSQHQTLTYSRRHVLSQHINTEKRKKQQEINQQRTDNKSSGKRTKKEKIPHIQLTDEDKRAIVQKAIYQEFNLQLKPYYPINHIPDSLPINETVPILEGHTSQQILEHLNLTKPDLYEIISNHILIIHDILKVKLILPEISTYIEKPRSILDRTHLPLTYSTSCWYLDSQIFRGIQPPLVSLLSPNHYFQHHYLRILSKATSAPVKYYEILNGLDFIVPSKGLILTTAEGAGSCLSLFMHIFPLSKFLYNTLWNEPDLLTIEDRANMRPPCLRDDLCNLPPLLNDSSHALDNGDLTNPLVWDRLFKVSLKIPLTLLTMDAECIAIPNHKNIIDSFSSTFSNCTFQDNCVLIFKINWSFKGILVSGWKSLHLPYITWYIVKPPSSNIFNSEVFLVVRLHNKLPIREISYDAFLKLVGKLQQTYSAKIGYTNHAIKSLKSQFEFINENPCFDYIPTLHRLSGAVVSQTGCLCNLFTTNFIKSINEVLNKELGDYQWIIPSIFRPSNEKTKLESIRIKIQDNINIFLLYRCYKYSRLEISDKIKQVLLEPGISVVWRSGGFVLEPKTDLGVNLIQESGLRLMWKSIGIAQQICKCDNKTFDLPILKQKSLKLSVLEELNLEE